MSFRAFIDSDVGNVTRGLSVVRRKERFCRILARNTTKNWVLRFAITICLMGGSFSCAEEPAFAVTKDVDIVRNIGGYHRVQCDLGSLPVGKRGVVTLNLLNTTKGDLELGQSFRGCSCATLTLSDTKVGAGKVVTATVTLTTPNNASDYKQGVSLTIGDGTPSHGLVVGVSYALEGLVSFTEPTYFFKIAERKLDSTFRIPLTVAPNTLLDDIRVDGVGRLKSLTGQIVQSDGKYFMEASLPASELEGDGFVGEIQITNRNMNFKPSALVTFVKSNPVEVVPTSLRLRWSESEKQFVGNAILRINWDAYPFSGRFEESEISRVVIGIAGQYPNATVTTSEKRLSKDVVRINCRVKPKVNIKEFIAERNGDSIFWVVSIFGKDLTAKTVPDFVVP